MAPDQHSSTTLRIERDGPITRVTLSRPEVRNAFNAELMSELVHAFTSIHMDDATRVVVLRGEGPSFCAGADINWMRDSINFSRQQNVEDATLMARMMEIIAQCGKPVVCQVHGKAFGGALGLMCAADYVVASSDAEFAFSEVKLGIVPAVISPFVLRRIGPGQARALFITGERFNAARAERIGLAHVVVSPDELEGEVERVVGELLTAAPEAIRVAKHLVFDLAFTKAKDAMPLTVETIATKRTDPEGQEGLTAFLERRSPAWATSTADVR